ncbi:MAG: LapA family protein [Burkholderiaceae bacterium]
MRVVSIALTILLFLVALGLALVNTQPAELRFFPFGEDALLTAPLVVWLCAFFMLGVAVGLFGAMPAWIRLRLRIRRAEKQLEVMRDAAARAGLTAGVNAAGQSAEQVLSRPSESARSPAGNPRLPPNQRVLPGTQGKL